MLLKPITVAAGFAVAAQAFLVPPEVSESDIKVVETIEALPPATKATGVELACPGCPVQILGKHGKIHMKTDIPNHLLLGFIIDEGSDSDRLLLNGFELYPRSSPLRGSLVAPQIPDMGAHRVHKEHKEDEKPEEHEGLKRLNSKHMAWKADKEHKEGKEGNRKYGHHRKILSPELGFGLQVQPISPKDGDDVEVISLDLQIIEVGTTFVDGIPSVHIDLLKDSNGKLLIGRVQTTPSQTLQATPMEKQEECTTMLCKWLTIVEDKIKQMKDMKAFKGKCKGNKEGAEVAESHRQHKHHGGRPHKMQHGQDRHSWRQLLKSIASHILLPVVVGILAGVFVSLIGMVFGTMIVSLWRLVFRRNSRRHAGRSHHRAAQKEVAAAEEKSGLMQNQDPPPYYEEEAEEAAEEAKDADAQA